MRHQMEEVMYSNAALAHSMTFKGLDPYQVNILCETIYAELERFLANRIGPRARVPSVNLAEFKHIQILGMRKFHIDQIDTQKASYDSFCEFQRLLSSIPRELTEKEKAEHIRKFKRSFDKAGRKKDPERKLREGLKVSGLRKSACS